MPDRDSQHVFLSCSQNRASDAISSVLQISKSENIDILSDSFQIPIDRFR